MWITFHRPKTNCTKFTHYRPKILKDIEFFYFSYWMQHSLLITCDDPLTPLNDLAEI